MKLVAKTEDYTIYQKRNQRYSVRKDDRNWVNGDDKVAILLEHKLIEVAAPKAPEPEAPAEEVAADAAPDAADEAEAPAE